MKKNNKEREPVTFRTFAEPLLYAAPFLLICITFVIWPVINVFAISFYEDYSFINQTYVSTGLSNYAYVLHDKYFISSLQNTFLYVFTVVPISAALALLFAVLLNSKIKFPKVFQTIYFLPMVTSSIAIGFVWRYMFNSDYGIINGMLNVFGVDSQKWLTHPKMAVWALIIFGIWNSIPFSIIMFLSGLQNIDQQYYTAAKLDGAGPFKIFFRITVPLLSPTIALVLVVRVISASKVFNEVYALWNGQPGPASSLYTMVYYIFEQFYSKWKVGYAAAAAVILFGIVFILTLIQLFVQKKLVHYK